MLWAAVSIEGVMQIYIFEMKFILICCLNALAVSEGSAYCKKSVLCNSSLMHKTFPFHSLSFYQNRRKIYYLQCIVGKKWEPRNPVPGPFSAKIRKVNQNSESRLEFGK